MAKYRVVVTDDRYDGNYDEEKKVLEGLDAELVIENCVTEDEVIAACKDADGIMCNLAPMGPKVICFLEKCKIISRYGVGYDNVAVDVCKEKGIYVANVTDYCPEEVSDQALGLLLACARKIARRDAQVRSGLWNIGKKDPIHRIAGKVFTFLGFGMIAKCLFRKIKGLNFSEVMVYDPFLDEKSIADFGAKKVNWEDALRHADFISLHMPVNEQTKGIINADSFALMKDSAILINTSRGALINEEDLIRALTTGQINSAGLDVHVKEPLDKDSPLMKIENCVLSDHVGWYSEESMAELKMKVAMNVRDVLLGGKPKYLIN